MLGLRISSTLLLWPRLILSSPPQVLSSESLDLGGVFLLENGSEALLHLDKNVQPEMVQALLGIGSYDELLRVPQPLVLLPREDPPAKALQDVLVKVGSRGEAFLIFLSVAPYHLPLTFLPRSECTAPPSCGSGLRGRATPLRRPS